MKEELIKFSEEKGFESGKLLLEVMEENWEVSQAYYLWLCLLQKWLREEHRIDVVPTFSKFSRTYGYNIYYPEDGETKNISGRFIKGQNLECSLEKGLYEALRLIKKTIIDIPSKH